jgi:hypothetical protein
MLNYAHILQDLKFAPTRMREMKHNFLVFENENYTCQRGVVHKKMT